MAQLLNNAYADGRLDFDEHSERMTSAYNAKTFGELDALTRDLIPHPTAQPRTQPTPTSGFLAKRPGHVPAAYGEFSGGRAILSSFKPGGPLVLPAYSEVLAILGDARIDLVGASFTQQETTIRVNAVLGEVRIRIPEGVHVVSNVSLVMGDYKCEGAVPGDRPLILKLEGTSMLSDVKVLGPDTKPRKFEKFI